MNKKSKKVFDFASTIITVLIILMVIDFVCFLAWGFSGQYPADGFYLGRISREILQAIFF